MSRGLLVASCLLLASGVGSRARGDDDDESEGDGDTVAGDIAYSPFPLEPTKVELRSLKLQAVFRAPKQFDVEVAYELHNPGTRPLDLALGLPGFDASRTWVADVAVAETARRPLGKHPWSEKLQEPWRHSVHMAPEETLRMRQTYTLTPVEDSTGGLYFEYAFDPAAAFAGPIRKTEVRVALPLHLGVHQGDGEVQYEHYEHARRSTPGARPAPGLRLADPVLRDFNGRRLAELTFEANDWEPQTTLTLLFYRFGEGPLPDTDETRAPPAEASARAGLPADQRCDAFEAIRSTAHQVLLTNVGPEFQAEQRARLRERIQASANSRRICRNQVFAYHGRRFADDALNRYFYGARGFVAGSWPFAPYEANPHFANDQLAPWAWQALRLIDELVAEGSTPAAQPAEGSTPEAPPGTVAADPEHAARPTSPAADAPAPGASPAAATAPPSPPAAPASPAERTWLCASPGAPRSGTPVMTLAWLAPAMWLARRRRRRRSLRD